MVFKRRVMKGNVFEEALDGEKALVAGLGAVAAAVMSVFEVLEESQNRFNVQIQQGDGGNAPMGVEVVDQELEGIAVALDGVGTEGPLLLKIELEEIVKVLGQAGVHRCLKTRWREAWVRSSKAL